MTKVCRGRRIDLPSGPLPNYKYFRMKPPVQLDWAKLGTFPIFQDLSPEELGQFLKDVQIEQFAEGDHLIRQGEEAHGLGILLQGKVKIFRVEPDGKQHFLSVLKEGDFFGEMALLNSAVRSATVEALAPTSVVWISAADFHRFVAGASPLIAKVLARMVADLSHRLRLLDERYVYIRNRTG